MSHSPPTEFLFIYLILFDYVFKKKNIYIYIYIYRGTEQTANAKQGVAQALLSTGCLQRVQACCKSCNLLHLLLFSCTWKNYDLLKKSLALKAWKSLQVKPPPHPIIYQVRAPGLEKPMEEFPTKPLNTWRLCKAVTACRLVKKKCRWVQTFARHKTRGKHPTNQIQAKEIPYLNNSREKETWKNLWKKKRGKTKNKVNKSPLLSKPS